MSVVLFSDGPCAGTIVPMQAKNGFFKWPYRVNGPELFKVAIYQDCGDATAKYVTDHAVYPLRLTRGQYQIAENQ